jgi:hypothetical protein
MQCRLVNESTLSRPGACLTIAVNLTDIMSINWRNGTRRARRYAADATKTAVKKFLYSPRSLRVVAPVAFLYANYIIKIVLADLKLTAMVSHAPGRLN